MGRQSLASFGGGGLDLSFSVVGGGTRESFSVPETPLFGGQQQ